MNYSDFKSKAFSLALEKGYDAELFMRDIEELTVEVLEGELDSYNFSRKSGATLRVIKDGREGYFYTESYDDPENAVARAIDNSLICEVCDRPLNGESVCPELPERDDTGERMGSSEMIALALDAEREAKKLDPRIKRMDFDGVTRVCETVCIENTRGLCAFSDQSLFMSALYPIAESDGETHDGSSFSAGREALSPKTLALKAAVFTLAKFGAEPVSSGDYRIVFQGKAFSQLLKTFAPQFSGEIAQKGLSPLAGKEGEMIASPVLSIRDDPLHHYSPRPFDDEGTPSRCTEVIKNGRLVTLLHNLKTAKKAGCVSTSNASRASISSPIGVDCSVFIVSEGEKDLDALLDKMGEGLLICELSGLHAGADEVSGDFSLLASGFEIKQGKIEKPVERITVAGNFNELLQNINEVGNDMYFGMPGGAVFASPSVYTEKGLKVSGK